MTDPPLKIEIITPQFEREAGAAVPMDAASVEFAALRHVDRQQLSGLGCRAWNDPTEPDDKFDGKVLMLFPGEWYERIPEDYEIVTIWGKRKPFKPGQTSDDIRFGCLAYGILVDP